jgi:hypothetical protein
MKMMLGWRAGTAAAQGVSSNNASAEDASHLQRPGRVFMGLGNKIGIAGRRLRRAGREVNRKNQQP